MPKAKWSNTDLTANDVESAEAREGTYAGPLPPKGVYRFKLRYIKQEKSKAGNDMLLVFGTIDPTWKPEHKQYKGCPLFDRIVLTKDWASKLKAACAAFGVTANDFFNKSVVDDDDFITKIGVKAIKEDMPYYVNVKIERSEDYDPKLTTNGDGYLAAPDEADGDADSDADAAPAAGKAKKKGGKKAASAAEEDPF